MSKKTYRFRMQLDGDEKPCVYRTDGVPTHCCEAARSYFCWEKNTKYNHYQGWSGYVSEQTLMDGLALYNPDNLDLEDWGLEDWQRIKKSFIKLGFEIDPEHIMEDDLAIFGTIAAEPYDTGKHHFIPRYRSVFFGTAKGGYYITSGIHGKMRQYRCRNEYDAEIANIFGHGKTVKKALENFAYNFTNKIYNRPSNHSGLTIGAVEATKL